VANASVLTERPPQQRFVAQGLRIVNHNYTPLNRKYLLNFLVRPQTTSTPTMFPG